MCGSNCFADGLRLEPMLVSGVSAISGVDDDGIPLHEEARYRAQCRYNGAIYRHVVDVHFGVHFMLAWLVDFSDTRPRGWLRMLLQASKDCTLTGL